MKAIAPPEGNNAEVDFYREGNLENQISWKDQGRVERALICITDGLSLAL